MLSVFVVKFYEQFRLVLMTRLERKISYREASSSNLRGRSFFKISSL